jgi:hypothetical protein
MFENIENKNKIKINFKKAINEVEKNNISIENNYTEEYYNIKLLNLKINLLNKKIDYVSKNKIFNFDKLNEEEKTLVQLFVKNLNDNQINDFLKSFLFSQFKNLGNYYSNQNHYSHEIKNFFRVLNWIGGKKSVALFNGDTETIKLDKKSGLNNNKKKFCIPSLSTIKRLKKPLKFYLMKKKLKNCQQS